MLVYTFTDMNRIMYVQKSVNVRNTPSADGQKLGSLNTNDEVKVTGQCAETSWYRNEYSGGVAYVSNSYLGNEKIQVQASAPEQSKNDGGYNLVVRNGSTYVDTTVSSYVEACAVFTAIGYAPWTFYDKGGEDMGRIYIKDANGGSWSISYFGKGQ